MACRVGWNTTITLDTLIRFVDSCIGEEWEEGRGGRGGRGGEGEGEGRGKERGGERKGGEGEGKGEGRGREQREHRGGERKDTEGVEQRKDCQKEGRDGGGGRTQLSCRPTSKGVQVPAHLGREVLYVHHEPAQEEAVGRRELSQHVLECTHLLLPLWMTS